MDFKALLPSGDELTVLTSDEVDWVEHTSKRYMDVFEFTNQMDLNALDRIVALELIVWRLNQWVARGKNYDDHVVLFSDVSEDIKKTSMEIRQIQKGLGVDKVARDKARGEGSIHEYLSNLIVRCEAFGVSRNDMYARAINLVNDLKTLIVTFDNMNEQERATYGRSPEQILDWCRTVMFPEFDEIDASFRAGNQKTWIKEM